MSNKTLIAFNYFGGKYTHADWVISKLPESKSYVEVFGGSAIVLLNKKPCRIETYNDISGTVVNFFKVLRENPEELLQQIYLTPYSREEYWNCFKTIHEGSDIERARKFYVTVNQSFNGSYSRQTGWKMSTIKSESSIAEALSRWLSKLPNLLLVIERLRKVQISNFDFRVVFEKFDSPDTLFYCDPPYVHATRSNNNEYEHEMTEQDHIEFIEIVKKTKGMVAISGYESALYNDLLKGFWVTKAKEKKLSMFHSPRKEVMWTNYDPDQAVNLSLFHANELKEVV